MAKILTTTMTGFQSTTDLVLVLVQLVVVCSVTKFSPMTQLVGNISIWNTLLDNRFRLLAFSRIMVGMFAVPVVFFTPNIGDSAAELKELGDHVVEV